MIIKQLVFTILMISSVTFAYGQQNYARIKVDLTEHTLIDFARLGVESDHGIIKKGRYIINDYSEREMKLITDAGFKIEILVENVIEHYQNQSSVKPYTGHLYQNKSNTRNENCTGLTEHEFTFDYDTPENYSYGSMGGYLTFEELLIELDSMHAKYPNLITAKSPMSTFESIEGRPLLYVKISDHPNMDESEEPELLYTALHHAREPNSLSQLIFYMWYLLENYDTDPEIKYIVDNTAMYFAPCINPDGYVFNQETNPNGGGLWRKNRRPNNDGSFGVDLNRNYGHKWGNDNAGSSPSPESNVYRGTEAFSEPELKAVKYFCENHSFKITLNYHTFGNLLIHPWGYSDTITADHETFRAIGKEMIKENRFTFGTGTETVGYTVNGDSDDWMYGAEDILSMTPEIGPEEYGFWPPTSAIDSINKTTQYMNITAAKSVLPYITANDITEVGQIKQKDFLLQLMVQNIGLSTGNALISIREISENTNFIDYTQSIDLNALASDTLDFDLSIHNENDHLLKFIITIDNNGIITNDTIIKSYDPSLFDSEPKVIWTESFDAIDQWETSDSWALSTDKYYSAPSSLTDSPNGNYNNNQTNIIDLKMPIDLSNITDYAVLKYKANWDIEKDWDYAQILISTDQETYIPQCGDFTNIGNQNQDIGNSLYHGNSNTWQSEEINLSDYVGQKIYLRFLLHSDQFQKADGIYIDDIEVITAEKEVAVSSIKDNNDIIIHPNPTYDILNIQDESNTNTFSFINIYDLSHKLLISKSGLGLRRISIKDLRSGMYILELGNESEIMLRRKIVKI